MQRSNLTTPKPYPTHYPKFVSKQKFVGKQKDSENIVKFLDNSKYICTDIEDKPIRCYSNASKCYVHLASDVAAQSPENDTNENTDYK